MSNLNFAVRKFLANARRSPVAAVGEALDELEREADKAFDGAYVSHTSPVATNTWMARMALLNTQQESAPDQISMGMPVEIVGFLPTILGLQDTDVLRAPPMQAIDLSIELNRREVITARAESGAAAGEDVNVVNLPMVSARIANRLIGWRLSAADPTISIQCRWAVPLAIVTAMGWCDVQVSLGIFVRRIED
ncbi:MAG: hypothetical protein KF718_16830 [Polyangiaceae bacterium]|nr:hypothetical protein [Polyangiaceae bacterium]